MDDFEGQIGIDLGTTYSCVAVWRDDHVEIIPNEKGNKVTPSWVAFNETEILVGEDAKEQASLNPRYTVFDAKRILGKKFSDDSLQSDLAHYPFEVIPDRYDMPLIKVQYKGEERTFKAEQISALVLTRMREIAEAYLGKRVKRAVITVPAYFNDTQRMATKNAATIAGLECDKIINEPTAACMCYGLDRRENNSKVLIFDLGGGTFDVSVLNLFQGVFEVLSTSGDTHLGGEDFDNILMENILQEFAKKINTPAAEIRDGITERTRKRFKLAVERAKRTLSTALTSQVELENFYEGRELSYKLTRSKFESWCMPLFQRAMEPVKRALEDAGLGPQDIDEVVLVGGSTRIPKVQEILQQYFSGKTLNRSVNPDEAVAYGAAVQGAILSKTDTSGKTKDLLLLDVTPLSLGIESRGGVMSVIIERNTQLPCKRSKVYSTVENGQTSVMINIYEGERKFTKDNHKIGDFELVDIPKAAKGVPKIEVRFSIDANGILTVTALDKDTGNANEIMVTDSARLTPEEVSKMVDEAEEFRADDEMRREALNVRHQFEKELHFTQASVNDPELSKDDDGKNLLSEEETSWINQYILNNLVWLEENEDIEKARIEEAKTAFMHGAKHVMSRIFARKKQLELARKYVNEEAAVDVQKMADGAFTGPSSLTTAGPSSSTPKKPKILVRARK